MPLMLCDVCFSVHLLCSLTVPSMFPLCLHYYLILFPLCDLSVSFLFPLFSHSVPSLFLICSHSARARHIASAQYLKSAICRKWICPTSRCLLSCAHVRYAQRANSCWHTGVQLCLLITHGYTAMPAGNTRIYSCACILTWNVLVHSCACWHMTHGCTAVPADIWHTGAQMCLLTYDTRVHSCACWHITHRCTAVPAVT